MQTLVEFRGSVTSGLAAARVLPISKRYVMDDLIKPVLKKLQAWGEGLISMLPNVIVAGLVLVFFWFVAKGVSKVASRAMHKMHVHDAARSLILTFIRIAVMFAGTMVALGVLNLDRALASILAGAGIVGLALGFAFQDLAANLISGIGLAIHKRLPFQINDVIETNDILGTVSDINLRTTMIQTFDGKTVILPNKQIYQEKLTNYTFNGRLRIDLPCGVSYGDDLERVTKVAKEALEAVEERDTSRDVSVYFEGFGDSSINFTAMVWIKYRRHTDFLLARHRAVLALKAAFDEADITIPFPIRTLDFGIKGGERLAQVIEGTTLSSQHGSN